MVNCLHRLRHDTVIRSNHQDCNIGNLSSAGTHGSERLMAGRIQEGDRTIVNHNPICTNVLGNTARLG